MEPVILSDKNWPHDPESHPASKYQAMIDAGSW